MRVKVVFLNAVGEWKFRLVFANQLMAFEDYFESVLDLISAVSESMR